MLARAADFDKVLNRLSTEVGGVLYLKFQQIASTLLILPDRANRKVMKKLCKTMKVWYNESVG